MRTPGVEIVRSRMLAQSVVICALLAQVAESQTVPAAADLRELQSARSFQCTFQLRSIADWLDDDPQPEVGEDENPLRLSFDAIDRKKRTARFIGNVGADDIGVIDGGEALHLLELTPSGNMTVTTVYAQRTENNLFKATHTRLIYMSTGPIPSQYYGFCRRLIN